MKGCAFESIVDLVGDRWSLYLIGALLDGPRRTTELASMLAPISTRTLADRLKRLESAGALVRRAYAEAPPRVEYELTNRGREMRPVLSALRRAAAFWEQTPCRQEGCRMCDIHCDLTENDELERAPAAPGPLARHTTVDITLL